MGQQTALAKKVYCQQQQHELLQNNEYYIYSLTQKYLHVVAKEEPQTRTVGGRAVHDGSRKAYDGQVGNSSIHVTGYTLCVEKTGSDFVLPILIRSQGFLKMADERTGSMHDVCSRLLSQSISINEQFLCGYQLVIDWPIPIDTN